MSTVNDILVSIEQQIPDVDPAGAPLYSAVPQSTLILWINDAGRAIAGGAPIIKDWYAVHGVAGQDVYVLPSNQIDVRRAFYNLLPLSLSPEADDIYISDFQGQPWSFGPHAQAGEGNSWHIWPAPSAGGSSTTLSSGVTNSDLALPVVNASGFQQYGFLQIDDEIIRYKTLPSSYPGNITNILRGQGATAPAAHTTGSVVTELNLVFQTTRLPTPIVSTTDPVEIPQPLWPLIELYVLAKVRSMEQREEEAVAMRQEFFRLMDKLSAESQLHKPRQGTQVRVRPVGPLLYFGRLYVP